MSNEINALGVKTKFLLSLFTAILLVGCGSDTDGTLSDSDHEDSEDLQYTADTSEATQKIRYHNQGKSCLSCHGANSIYKSNLLSRDHDDDDDDDDDNDEQFTSAGTVYTAIDAANLTSLANGYRLRLVLENTDQVVNYSSGRGTANSYTEYGIGTINSYTAHVVDGNGNVVNSSLSSSHDVTRLDCNSCHTAAGNNGAPGRITSYDYYASLANITAPETNTTVSTNTTTDVNTTVVATATNAAISFTNDVMPVLEAKCKSCHGSNGNITITDTMSTYANITSNGFVDTASVDSSSLLTKGSGTVLHLGGSVVSTTSTEYTTLKSWITQGALNN